MKVLRHGTSTTKTLTGMVEVYVSVGIVLSRHHKEETWGGGGVKGIFCKTKNGYHLVPERQPPLTQLVHP